MEEFKCSQHTKKVKKRLHSQSQMGAGKERLNFSFLVFFLTIMLSLQSILAQDDTVCNPSIDCNPPATDLVDLTFINRTLEVSSACGVDNVTTEYTVLRETDQIHYCNESDPHPKENMMDKADRNFETFTYDNPVIKTYWQSDNTVKVSGGPVSEEFVIMNLTDPFLIRSVTVTFLAPLVMVEDRDYDMRPKSMVIERQNVSHSDWEPLRYFAEDCSTTFAGIPVEQDDGPNYDALTAACFEQYYGGHVITYTGLGPVQQVLFNPAKYYNPEYSASYRVQSHYIATAIRIRLVNPSSNTPSRSYYAVADLEIDGQCACFGHSNECTGPNNALCNCVHNTMGSNCEDCMPLYNNKPWSMGYDGKSNACEDCGCNGHATSCIYDDSKGYGVCDGCTDRTAGDKCDFCIDFFYVNPDRSNTTITEDLGCTGHNGTSFIEYNCGSWCIPCNCSLVGTVEPETNACDNYTGQCLCKDNVQGRICDECKDGFWDLTDRVTGCKECECDAKGTINSSNLCDKDTGICVCKANTYQNNCGQCKPTYYGLSADNPDGCTPCNCDPGGSTSLECPDSGTCTCRNNIGGKMCDTPATGFYVPSLDSLKLEAEFAPNATVDNPLVERPGSGEVNGTVTARGFIALESMEELTFGTIQVPHTLQYEVVIRYETGGVFSGAEVTLKIKPNGQTNNEFECGGKNVSTNAEATFPKTIQPAEAKGSVSFGFACMKTGEDYTVTLTLATVNGPQQGSDAEVILVKPEDYPFLVDSVVLIPKLEEISVYSEADNVTQAAIADCVEQMKPVNDLNLNTSDPTCSQYGYSLMSEISGGAVACKCDGTGSVELICDPIGGQCPCKPNVMLQDCSQCKVDHYGFGNDGCTACNCDINGSVKTACNESGICECKANVTNIKCDSCIPEHYGLYTGNGCVECTCNMVYALNNSCMDSGQCHCKPGIGGLECTECLDGFFNITTDGCTPCECNEGGSATGTCNKETGVCTCKSQAVGEKCDACPEAHFGLGTWGPDGCLACSCSGQSTNCTTAEGWYQLVIQNNWGLLEGYTAIEDRWSATDDEGQSLVVEYPTAFSGPDAQFVMKIENEDENLFRRNIYYQALDKYLGNQRGAYGQTFSFTISQVVPPKIEYDVYNVTTNETTSNTTEAPSNTTASPETVTILVPREVYGFELYDNPDGDIVLQGKYNDFTLVNNLTSTISESIVKHTYKLNEDHWYKDKINGDRPTYVEMIQTLSTLKSIYIRGKYTNATGAIVLLYNVEMLSANTTNTTGIEINNIDECVCPEGYTGQFCEQCEVGYRRKTANGGPLVECVPCNCNSHALGGAPCDPESGICQCTHNTMGDHCEMCKNGYYGDATQGASNDCSACMCPGNVPSGAVNSFAATCSVDESDDKGHRCTNCTEGHGGNHCEFCVNHWYGTPKTEANNGGKCVPCVCNSRADTCNNQTGICVDCSNNTAGKECEICTEKYYGNPMTNEGCKECGCTSIGSTGECDHRSGKCECKPNVEGFECNECAPNSYNISSGEGCYPCDCHEIGSKLPQCNVTSGDCDCKDRVIGRQCDACEETYWNITPAGCQPCQCTEEGTRNVTGQTFGTCDLVTGQCQCLPELSAVIGRTCDACAKGSRNNEIFIEVEYTYVGGIYIDSYSNCTVCGECFDNWAVKIDDIGKAIKKQNGITMEVWAHYDNMTSAEIEPLLTAMRTNLTNVQASIEQAKAMMTSLMELTEGYQMLLNEVDRYNTTAMELEEHLAYSESNLTVNIKSFDGTVVLNQTLSLTTNPTDLQNKTTETQLHHEESRNAATSSFNLIESMSDVVKNSNNSVGDYKTTVKNAMALLDQAEKDKISTQKILNGTYSYESVNNTASLISVEKTTENYQTLMTEIETETTQASEQITLANTTINTADTTVETSSVYMDGKVDEASIVKFNSSEALKAAQTAETATNIYLNLTGSAKDDMTDTMEELAGGLKTIDEIETQGSSGSALSDELIRIQLRPLSEMQSLATEIDNTVISQEDVDKTLNAATGALQLAEDALESTLKAEEESKMTLEQVETIRDNLDNAASLQNQTEYLIRDGNKYNNTVHDIIETTNNKTSKADNLAKSTTTNIQTILTNVDDIYMCYSEKITRSQVAVNKSKVAVEVADEAVTLSLTNTEMLMNVTKMTDVLIPDVKAKYASVQETETLMDALKTELDQLDQIADLTSLLNDVSSQKSEMDGLLSELNYMEKELESVINSLAEFEPDKTTCTHNKKK